MKTPIENRMGTIFVHVSDLEKSVRWYAGLFGLELPSKEITGPVFTFNMGEGRPLLTLDNHCLDDHYDLQVSNQPLFNLNTFDINQAYQYVQECEAEIVSEIETFSDVADFCFKDPDGNVIMACQMLKNP